MPTPPKVQFTTNLEQFKLSNVNRKFDTVESTNRIKRIAESMKKDGLLIKPITVSPRMIVIDGQHRLQASKIAKCGIYFMIDHTIKNTPTGIFNSAILHNSNAKEWSKMDYLAGNISLNNKHYKILDDFRKEYSMFSLTEILMFLLNSGTKYLRKTDFAEGKFEVKDLDWAREWANNLLSLKPYFDGYNRANFVRAMLMIAEHKPEFKFDYFLNKVKLNRDKIYLCGDKPAYLLLIENIYNFRTYDKNKLSLRF